MSSNPLISIRLCFSWVRSFLTNQIQAVRINSSLSPWKQVNGGVPQGTKLGLTLFAVMINKLLKNWHMRTKSAFKKPELAGRTMAGTDFLAMK